MPEVFLPAEVLMIGILYPAPHRFFVRYVKRVTQIGLTVLSVLFACSLFKEQNARNHKYKERRGCRITTYCHPTRGYVIDRYSFNFLEYLKGAH